MVARGRHRPSAAADFRLRFQQEMDTMRKTWYEQLFGSPQRLRLKRSYKPWLEQLERRLTPINYTWTNKMGMGDGIWEHAENWNPNTGYPSTTDDTANFTGQFQSSCEMTQQETISGFATSGWTGQLTLDKALTLTGASTSLMTGKIVQQTAGTIELASRAGFSWEGGDINPTAGASTFTVDRNAWLTVGPLVNNKFGDNLNNSGQVTLSNSGSNSITLVNKPLITNTTYGTITITTDNTTGIVVADSDVQTIANSGTITKTGGDEAYYNIDDPVYNNSDSASISVNSGTLRFAKADADSGYSVFQSAGRIVIRNMCQLSAGFGVKQTDGITIGLGPFATIGGSVQILGGTLQQGNGTAISAGQLIITGNLAFLGGTLHTWVDTTSGANNICGNVLCNGNVTVDANATSVVVDKIGNNALTANTEIVLQTNGGTISDTPGGGTVTGTANYTLDYRSLDNTIVYVTL
jgi:hypothetical protein